MELITDAIHQRGCDNPVADALSRAPVDAVSLGVSPEELREAQQSCPDVEASRTAVTSLKLKDVLCSPLKQTLLCDVSLGFPRPLVPISLRRRIFETLHSLSHPGVRATQKLIAQRYVWHRMKADIATWCRSCLDCQTAKVHHHAQAPVQAIPVPDAPFSSVNMDIVGPLPPSNGYTYLFTVVDRHSRWLTAIPMRGITAVESAQAFLHGWVSLFGTPTDITSDRGRQFTSALWSALVNSLGASLHRTTSYHPQSNGIVERMHRTLKAALRARLTGPDWYDQLPWVLLGLRNTPKDDLDASPASLVFRHSPLLPGDLFSTSKPPPGCPSFLPRHHAVPNSNVPKQLNDAAFVFVRVDAHHGPLEAPYQGPFRVLQRTAKTFTLEVKGRSEVVSIDRLKPAIITDPTSPPSANYRTLSGRIVRPPVRFSHGGEPCGDHLTDSNSF